MSHRDALMCDLAVSHKGAGGLSSRKAPVSLPCYLNSNAQAAINTLGDDFRSVVDLMVTTILKFCCVRSDDIYRTCNIDINEDEPTRTSVVVEAGVREGIILDTDQNFFFSNWYG